MSYCRQFQKKLSISHQQVIYNNNIIFRSRENCKNLIKRRTIWCLSLLYRKLIFEHVQKIVWITKKFLQNHLKTVLTNVDVNDNKLTNNHRLNSEWNCIIMENSMVPFGERSNCTPKLGLRQKTQCNWFTSWQYFLTMLDKKILRDVFLSSKGYDRGGSILWRILMVSNWIWSLFTLCFYKTLRSTITMMFQFKKYKFFYLFKSKQLKDF